VKREEKVSTAVLTKIERAGPGSIWTYEDFKGLPFIAVAKALSRLVASNKIIRVRKGVYFFPKETLLGKTDASPIDLVKKIAAKKKKTFYPDAATSAYNLRISTQVPAVTTHIGADDYRTLHFRGADIKFSRRSVAHLKNATKTEVYILEVLRHINKIPGASAEDILVGLKPILKKMDVNSILKFALKEPPRVRALLGAILSELRIKNNAIEVLKESLNPLTHYKLGLSGALAKASDWNIE
jgi:hypothetical protein